MTTPERDPGYPYGEFDAHEWAIEFDRIYPDHRPDSDTMLGWFANAIMTGYDRGKNEAVAADRATIATLRAALDGLVETAEAVLASDALDPDEFLALDRALRAALADAKETP